MADDPVTRARALVGTRFRLHGRDASGVDCIGVIAHAHRLAVPSGYAMRSDDSARLEQALVELGFATAASLQAGAVIVLQPGPVQLHLGLWTGDALIHADALLRRVVETPGLPRWPILSIWTI